MTTGTASQKVEFRACLGCGSIHQSGSVCPGCGGGLTLVGSDFLEGKTLGKYLIEKVLGEGGMGVVYEASHVTLGKRVALKLLLPQLRDNYEGFTKRFLREARVLAELRHPNIVEVYDFDLTDWHAPYYVMEHLRGLSLYDALSLHEGPLPESWTAFILDGIAAGLSYAHGRGVVHRDLKPDNVFITTYGGRAAVRILDFGIAKVMGDEGEATRLTMTGTVMGTPRYLAPEQLFDQKMGPWTDQYALALIAAEMLSGRSPRAGKTVGEILADDIRKPLNARELGLTEPEGRIEALARASMPQFEERFGSVVQFLEALQLKGDEETPLEIARWMESLDRLTGENGDSTEDQVISRLNLARVNSDIRSPHSISAMDTPTIDIPSGAVSRDVEVQSGETTEPKRSFVRRRLVWIAGLVLLLLIFGGTALKFFSGSGKGGKTRGDSMLASTSGTEGGKFLEETKIWQLPPDADTILGQEDSHLVISGAGGVHIFDQTSGESTKVSYAPGDELLCGDGASGVYLLRKGTLILWFPLRNRTEKVSDGIPRSRKEEGFVHGAVSPDGSRLLLEDNGAISLLNLDGDKARVLFKYGMELKYTVPAPMAAGEESAAFVVPGGDVVVLDSRKGEVVGRFHLKEGRPHAVALNEARHIVAAAGWFDRVPLYDYREGRQLPYIPTKIETSSITWLGDGNTLVIAGKAGLALRKLQGKGLEIPAEKIGFMNQVYWGEGDIFGLDEKSRLHHFSVNGLPGAKLVKLGDSEIWGMAAPASGTILAGDSSGKLFEIKDAEVTKHSLHTAGITAMASDGGHLATSSDDKTIAVWKLPELQVEFRSKAHAFLVNGLYLTGSDLWSASSDGSVKRWGWPDLVQKETLDTGKILKESKSGCRCVWASSDAKRVLVGTWGNRLLELNKTASGWKGKYHHSASDALYQVLDKKSLDVVLFSGVDPGGVYLYDLKNNTFHQLPDLGAKIIAVCSDGSTGAWFFGPGSILHYVFSRDDSGAVGYRVTGGMETRLHAALVGVITDGGRKLLVANERGEVFAWDTSELEKHLGPAIDGIIPADG